MGNYVNGNLGPNESVIDETKLHKILFLTPIIIMLLAVVCLMANVYVGLGLLFISIILFLARLIKYICTEVALTNNRIIIKAGFISRTAADISLKRVGEIDITDPAIYIQTFEA
jgi:uncharacterized membrane protein YdbT with pleckstrin-like domain